MNDVPSNVVAIVAIAVLGMIAGFAIFNNINHGLLYIIIICIAGLAGYKIKGIVDEKAILQLKELIDSDK